MTTKVTVGDTYKNKHNDRIIKIIERVVTDSGTVLYKALDTADQSTDYIGDYNFDEHWEPITEVFDALGVPMAFDDPLWGLRQDAEFVVDDFSRADLIDHLVTLYEREITLLGRTIEAHDACDTHSQTIITSDGED